MRGKEQIAYSVSQENRGMLNKYKKFNKITRNIGVGVGLAGLAFGIAPLAAVGLGSAAFDQGQIIAINKYQEWRNRKKTKRASVRQSKQSGNMVEFAQYKAAKQEWAAESKKPVTVFERKAA